MTAGRGLIAKARMEAGLSLQQLADRMGVAKGTVHKAELNPFPSVYILDKYGKAMGLELVVQYVSKAGDVIE